MGINILPLIKKKQIKDWQQMIKTIFPEPIIGLPEAEINIKGIQAFLSQGNDHQILFMEFKEDAEIPEHSHSAQYGIVLEGKIDVTINGETQEYKKGDRYFIPDEVNHSVKIYAGYADITFFNQKDRYSIKKELKC